MSNTNNGGAAFPANPNNSWCQPGMTLRQYAAIKLRVPQSGDVWLDVMIEDSLRHEFAAKAMQAFIQGSPSGTRFGDSHINTNAKYAHVAYVMADAMLRARDGGAA